MSFREKSAWIAVLTTLGIWGFYFSALVTAFVARQIDGERLLATFWWCIGATFVVMIALNIVAARVARQKMDAPPDERERAIDARANKIGLTVLELMGLGIVALGPVVANVARADFPADPAGITALLLTNGLLFALVAAATLREIVQIVQFRMMD